MARKSDRRITIRSIRRNPPDLRKLGRALIALAIAQAEAEARADDEARNRSQSEMKDEHPPEVTDE